MPTAHKLITIFPYQQLEIKRLDAFLKLLSHLYLIDDPLPLLFVRVDTRVQTPEDLADLAVEALGWYLLAGCDVLLSFLVVLLSVLWKGVEGLEDGV